uniref:Reverse transcriptase zinc-binding domain-containing protein n=1 Tax=Setaria viridis TaxID=4556 RepID=A0A4U6UBM8_SETVI|nr:hypothetical protein SEVIR_5G094600v2 [Setaria viridis]
MSAGEGRAKAGWAAADPWVGDDGGVEWDGDGGGAGGGGGRGAGRRRGGRRCQAESGASETCDHIIFHCPFVANTWSSLGVDTSASSVASLWTVPHPTIAPGEHSSTFLILLCWSLWKHRNDVVFQRAPASSQRFWTTCCEEARLWRERFKPSDQVIADAWCSVFRSM